MISVVNFSQENINFNAKPKKKEEAEKETRIVKNTPKTSLRRSVQRTSSAFIDYPVKGLQGDINSNFYEFLTMGIVPYLTGSAMFMAVFNCVNKFLEAKGRQISSIKGNKFALGVVFYGLFKTLSKNFVSTPVKLATGVDVEMPYENKVYNLPTEPAESAKVDITWQQRKIYDSKEFYRKDLLGNDHFDLYDEEVDYDKLPKNTGKKYYNNIAKKLGLGTELNDSATEVNLIIQNIVATSSMAKSITSYFWAALGVCLATQDDWIGFFDTIKNRTKYIPKEGECFVPKTANRARNLGKNTLKIGKSFINSFGGASKSLWNGNAISKHAGKGLILTTAGLTAFLTANTIIRAKNLAKNRNKNTIDKTKESMVI